MDAERDHDEEASPRQSIEPETAPRDLRKDRAPPHSEAITLMLRAIRPDTDVIRNVATIARTDTRTSTMSTQQKKDVAQQAPRPNLDQLYKPVGIQAVTAATLCSKKSSAKPSADKVKH